MFLMANAQSSTGGLLTKDVIQFVMSEEKPNQREMVKVHADVLFD